MKKAIISLVPEKGTRKILGRYFLLMVCAIIITGMIPSAYAATFTPRTTAPTADNQYYCKSTYNPFASAVGTLANVPNCTTYAWGRAYEILGYKPSLPMGNANQWYDNADYKGTTPCLGAIACWASGVYGHVAVVEKKW